MVSAVLNWVTVTVDFANAFVQSKLPEDRPVWMHIPCGYHSTEGPETCLRLEKFFLKEWQPRPNTGLTIAQRDSSR